jgi:hypothetical protein
MNTIQPTSNPNIDGMSPSLCRHRRILFDADDVGTTLKSANCIIGERDPATLLVPYIKVSPRKRLLKAWSYTIAFVCVHDLPSSLRDVLLGSMEV